MKKSLLLTSLLLGLAGLAVFSQTVHAADSNGREEITISPTTKKYELNPGDTATGSLKVFNTGDTTFNFTLYARPYSVSNVDYTPDYTSTSSRANAYTWVQFDTTEATLKPRESKEISYTVRVPKDATIGGHYGILFAEVQPSSNDGNQVVRKKRIGSILRVNVNGDISENGSVVASSLPYFQSSPPLKTSIDVKNDGNVDFEADSKISVSDIFGSLKFSSEKTNIVYPDTTRRIDQDWNDASWLGIYKVDISTDYLGKNFHESHYMLILPRWFIAIAVMAVVGGAYAWYIKRH